jgi:oligosaccharide repeat unit polymerase
MVNLDLEVEILFWIIYLMTPITGFFLLRSAKIDILKISIPSIFFNYFIIVSYVGILPIFYGWNSYAIEIGVVDASRILTILLYNSFSLLLIIFGFFVMEKIVRGRYYNISHYEFLSKKSIFVISWIAVVCIIVGIIFLKKIPQIPLFLISDPINAKIARSEATNAFMGKYHRYQLFFGVILPFCVYVLLGNALIKKKIRDWIIFFIFLTFAIFFSIFDIQKAPLLWLILGCYFVYCRRHEKKINVRMLTQILFIVISISVLLVGFFMGGLGRVKDTFFATLGRIFCGAIIPIYFYLEIFPHQQDYLFGKSLPNPMNIFPWEHYRLTVEVMNYIFPYLSEKNIVGSAPTVYWGEIYANVGPIGIFAIAPLIGMLLFLFHMELEKLKNNPVKIALIVWVGMHFMMLSETGVSYLLFDTKLITVLLIGLFVNHIDKKNYRKE